MDTKPMDTKPNHSSRVLERLKATMDLIKKQLSELPLMTKEEAISVVYNDFMELWKSCNEQERQQFLEELNRLLKEL